MRWQLPSQLASSAHLVSFIGAKHDSLLDVFVHLDGAHGHGPGKVIMLVNRNAICTHHPPVTSDFLMGISTYFNHQFKMGGANHCYTQIMEEMLKILQVRLQMIKWLWNGIQWDYMSIASKCDLTNPRTPESFAFTSPMSMSVWCMTSGANQNSIDVCDLGSPALPTHTFRQESSNRQTGQLKTHDLQLDITPEIVVNCWHLQMSTLFFVFFSFYTLLRFRSFLVRATKNNMSQAKF